MLYKPLSLSIQEELNNLLLNHQTSLIYFSSDFKTYLRKITSCPINELEHCQPYFDSFSWTYLKTLNKTRVTLGLPKISTQYRIQNQLFKNPSTARMLSKIQKYETIIFLIALIIVLISFFILADDYKNLHGLLLNIVSYTFIFSFLIFILSGAALFVTSESIRY